MKFWEVKRPTQAVDELRDQATEQKNNLMLRMMNRGSVLQNWKEETGKMRTQLQPCGNKTKNTGKDSGIASCARDT